MPEVLQRRPERLNITNLQTGEGFFVQFNPSQFKRATSAIWTRHDVVGLTYQPQDYVGTKNAVIPLNLYFRAETATTRDGGEDVLAFLESLLYPPDAADTLSARRPPRCLIIWPNTFSFAAILTSIDIQHERFDLTGATFQWTAKVVFEEARRGPLSQETVRTRGAFRAPRQSGGE